MTRREFSALAALPLAAAAKPRPISIFSKHLQWLSIADAAAFAKECGFESIDLTVRKGGHVEPEGVETELPMAADTIRKAGVELGMITTAIVDADHPDTAPILRAAAKSGVKHYRWGGWKYDLAKPVPAQIDQGRRRGGALAALNEKHGVCGIYHVHSGIAQHGASVWDILISLRDHNPKFLAVNYDLGHATVEGGFGGWIHSFHASVANIGGVALKDFLWKKNAKGEWRPVWVPLGEGMVNFAEFGKMLNASPFDGPVQLHMEYDLGGAGHGDRKITWTRDQVMAAMRQDLARARVALTA